ncbi:hypothetical protein HUJ04_009988 [Dendroctonus ponderosae]|nr:hypothetical protein HUJ04_009988 [Dendroctonus ponderosae]
MLHQKRLDETLGKTHITNINSYYEVINKCIQEAEYDAFGSYKKHYQNKPYWWDEAVPKMTGEKKQKYQKYLN